MPRKYTIKLLDMMEEGILNPFDVASYCLSYMSESDVEDMMRINGLLDDEEDTEDE